MTKRQARVAAILITASYSAHTDTPGCIDGVSDNDTAKVVGAINIEGWRMLARYGFDRTLTTDEAVAYAIANY